MSCSFCNASLIETNGQYTQLPKKSCESCNVEFAVCFCGVICKTTLQGKKPNKYEYLSCKDCDYLGVRCTECKKLCEIKLSGKEANYPYNLYWRCDCEKFGFKGFLEDSLRNHVSRYRKLPYINEDVLCNFVINCVELSYFKYILIGIQNTRSLDFKIMISLIKEKYPCDENIIKLIEDCKPKSIDTSNTNTPNTLQISNTPRTPYQLNENNIYTQQTPTQYNNYQQQEEFVNQIDLNEFFQQKFNYVDKKLEEYGANINDLKRKFDDKNDEDELKFKDMDEKFTDLNNKLDKFNEFKNSFNEFQKTTKNNFEKFHDEIVESIDNIKISNEVKEIYLFVSYFITISFIDNI